MVEAPPPPPSAQVGERRPAIWLDAPTRAEVAAARPRGLTGFGILVCRARSNGTLERCRLTGRSPERHALSRATLSLRHRFRLARAVRPSEWVQVPLWFRDEAPYVDRVTWRNAPRGEDLDALLRPVAGERPASATLDCQIVANGRLEDCRALNASTPEVGAALTGWATSQLAVSALTGQGAPVVGARMRLPVSYRTE